MARKSLDREQSRTYTKNMPVTATQAEAPNTSAKVLDFLRSSPGQAFSPKEIADALALVPGRVSASLQYLNRQYDEVVNEGRGSWSWKEAGGTLHNNQPRSGVELLAPVARALEGAGMSNTKALPESMPALFEPVTTHRSGAIVLRDANGDLWLAQPIHIEVWPVLGALGFESPEAESDHHKH